jgi:hypothetical protein
MKNLFSIFMLLALTACSSMEFNTSGKESFYVGVKSGSEKELSVEATKDFYFWGLSPDYAEFNFQDEMKGLGVYNPSFVNIEQSYTFKDIAFTLMTLGLYCPVTYKLSLLTNGSVK